VERLSESEAKRNVGN